MISVRWHGRGGQGIWTAGLLLTKAAIREGKYAQSFPEFGPEREGAPVRSFTRISDKPILVHCNIYHPDIVVVSDPTLMKTVDTGEGLREGGIAVINTKENPKILRGSLKLGEADIWVVPATDIAVKILGTARVSTAMLGALVKATNIVKLRSVIDATLEQFKGRMGELNVKVVRRSYEETSR